ncbi:DUF2529 family protein [Salsuginibacillus kocurii]|uniref:DUF2529 family protein n=1 Tax=Salsuginibacillus kocurii TaxID=427078 RepID=UPI00058B8B60|nr:DUF2529 family protein [Salsuginibacillus kocurii]
MFTTQLQAVFQKIQNDEEALEDSARLLAQATVGEGTIYITGSGPTKELAKLALTIKESPKDVTWLEPGEALPIFHPADRVLLFSGDEDEDEMTHYAQSIYKTEVPFISIGSFQPEVPAQEGVLEPVHLPTYVKGGLVPDEEGTRHGHPGELAALYAYQLLLLVLQEMIEE